MEATGKRIQAVYAVVSRPEGRDLFLRVGNAFPNRDGSTTLLLDALPLGGKLHVRDYLPKDHHGARGDAEGDPPRHAGTHEPVEGRQAELERGRVHGAEPERGRVHGAAREQDRAELA
jgi:hypothetical protein